MFAYSLPLLYTLIVWWFSTGAILYLDKRAPSTHARSLGAAAVMGVLALAALVVTRNDNTPLGAYVAFTCSVLVWGWQEMAFLMGFVTGPNRAPCPAGCVGLRRFVAAAQTVLYHELALAGSLLMIAALTWNGSNRVGLSTFLVLWVMRLSAKLNLFLGVRNRSEDFLPDHLRYLQTFFKRQTINLLFPVSVLSASVVAYLGWTEVFAHDAMSTHSTRLNLVCALLSLAIVEHWFMVLPLNPSALWQWAMRKAPATL